jgi:hypothetical protein
VPREAVSIVSWSAWSVGRDTLEGRRNLTSERDHREGGRVYLPALT